MADVNALRAELADPALDPGRLAAIAAETPELMAEAAGHPRAYPALLDWIAEYGDETAKAAVAAVRAGGVPAVPAPPAAPPVPPPPSDDAPAAPSTPTRPRVSLLGLSGRALAIVGGITAGVLVLGGAAVGVVAVVTAPPQSPTAVTERLLTAAEQLDPFAAVGSIAPSERGLLDGPLRQLKDLRVEGVDEEQARSLMQSIQHLKDALDVTTEGIQWTEAPIVRDQVVRVTLAAGTLRIDGDEQEVADALWDVESQLLRMQYQAYGYGDPSDIDDEIAQQRQYFEDSIRLPQTLDAGQLLADDEGGLGISVVTVHEGSGWYLSPILTAADLLTNASYRYGDEAPELGSSIPQPVVARSPQDAFAQTARAFADGDWEGLAATLPLPERRLLAIYGPSWSRDQSLWGSMGSEWSIDFQGADFGDVRGGQLRDWTVTFTGQSYGDDWTLEFDGPWCLAMTQYGDRNESCLDQGVDLHKLGIDDPALVAVQTDGGWQFSVVGTLQELLTEATSAIVDASHRDGGLQDLFDD